MTIYYNSKNNAFYDSLINEVPDDSVEITQEQHSELLKNQADGLVIRSDEKGFPVAIERFLTADEIKTSNESKQQQLIDAANEKIVILQRAVKYNRATDAEKSLLEQLELFTIDVARVDVSDVNAVFPEMS